MKKDDIVTAAINKARQELAIPEDEKIAANIKSLYKRLAGAHEKLTDAKAENSSQVEIFQRIVDKLKYEIYSNRQVLRRIKADIAMASSKPNKLNDSIANSSGLSGKR
jgi:chromosome segregation ATPase